MRVLITGATSGMGKALTEAFAQRGAVLFLHGRNKTLLADLQAQFSTQVKEVVTADLAQVEEIDALSQWIKSHPIDLLINNAGFTFYGTADTLSPSEQKDIVMVNALAVQSLSLAAIQQWKWRTASGVILNIASAAAFLPGPGFASYAASKAFVVSLSRSLHAENRSHAIDVLCACPGMVDTPFQEKASRGLFNKKNLLTLSTRTVTKALLRQIETKQPLQIIDWKYSALLLIAKCLPQKWIGALLYRRLTQRMR